MIFSSLFESRASLENPSVPLSALAGEDAMDLIFGSGNRSEAGESITTAKALSYSPVWQAVKKISGDVSKLPLKIYRRTDNGGREQDTSHQAFPFINLLGKANAEVSSLKLWRRAMAQTLLFENGYIWIDRDNNGKIHGLYNLLPDRTAPMRVGGKLWYVTEVNQEIMPLPADDVMHIEGLCWDNNQAPNLVKQARHDFGVAIAARKFTSKFFANGAHLGGILQVPPTKNKIARQKIEKAINTQRSGGDNAFKTLVLREAYRWHSTSVEPQKAQLIELDEQQVRHVARWFMLSPDQLGVSESISYNSLEQSRQNYFDSALSYWLTCIKSEANCKLLTERERQSRSHFIDYEINALLWTDAKTRNEIATAGIQSGRFSPDETRAWENLNPRPDGKGGDFMQPMNMSTPGNTETPSDKDENNES